ncbi:MAG: hypothetical protein LUF30_11575 [Lachnospiraceae bacterium]|nr:hypothetical protein [Lachnospiraceae bacterium]
MGGDSIKLSTQSKRKEIDAFLDRLKTILCNIDFDIDKDLVIIRSKKDSGKEIFSTPYTLLDLEYDKSDIAQCLRELMIENYAETLVDKDNVDPPLLYVFGKVINNKQVYIKLKIRENEREHILCVPFHYAKEKMCFPYQ